MLRITKAVSSPGVKVKIVIAIRKASKFWITISILEGKSASLSYTAKPLMCLMKIFQLTLSYSPSVLISYLE
ncbi:hypothetical protein DN37_3268 [Vibrio cholerae]|nr:hypothetical protein DN37_3268 [Vibrio cholerae]